MIRFACPLCSTNLKSPAGAAGRIIRCPRCGGQTEVPFVFQGGAPPVRVSPVSEELSAGPSADVPYGPLAFSTPEWESPERPSKTGPLAVSVVLVVGLFLLIVFIVARKNGPDESPVAWGTDPQPVRPRPVAHPPEPDLNIVDPDEELDPALRNLERPGLPQPEPRQTKPRQKPRTEEEEPEPVIRPPVPPPSKDSIPAPTAEASRENLDRLIKNLKSNNEAERIKAAQKIGEMGDKARDARQALCDALWDRRITRRIAVAVTDALEKVDPLLHKPVVTLVVDKDQARHREALLSLAKLQADGKPALPLVLAYGKGAVTAVWQQRGVEVNVGDVRNGDVFIQTLAAIDPDDKEVLEVLKTCLRFSKNPSAKVQAARGLARASHRKEAVEVLKNSLKTDRNDLVRVEVAHALGDIGPDARDAAEALEGAKLDPSAPVREAASAALRKIKG